MNMALSKGKIKSFKRIGHALKPLVTMSEKGITEGVAMELERALNDHELIKVKLSSSDRDLKKQLIAEMCTQANCKLVQTTGHVALIYRAASKSNPKLSNVSRYYSS